MELRHLRYFVTVAEELHFGRAAKRLHMAQPPLSQQIRQLEEELGIVLFHRTSHHVALTEAGAVFLNEVRRLLAQLEESCRTVQCVGRGEVGSLRLGFIDSAVYDVLPILLQAYHARFPDVEVVLRQRASWEQIDDIQQQQLDLGIVRPPVPQASLETLTIRQEPFVVVLPRGHSLVEQQQIPLAALAREPFVFFSRHIKTQYVTQVLRLCQQAGFEPRVAQEVYEMQTLVGLVAAGLGVSLVGASTCNLLNQGVVYRPLQESADMAELVLVWRSEDVKETVKAFLDVVHQDVSLCENNIAWFGETGRPPMH